MSSQKFRVKDLFAKSGFDSSGDGSLNVYELENAIGRLGLAMRPAEVRVLLEWLDASGDGEIEAKELEDALRRLHRDVEASKSRDARQAKAAALVTGPLSPEARKVSASRVKFKYDI